jgi:glycosyltransferase involved in cell wall biosynthesis
VSSKKWICCQIGAREHYAVPRALHQTGRLAELYTEFWAGPLVRFAGGTGFRILRSLATRFHEELANAKVKSWNCRSLFWEARVRNQVKRKKQKGESGGIYHGFIDVGRRFAVRVRQELMRRSDVMSDAILFVYDTGGLEAMEWCRERGIRCVLNQMDPNRVEVEMVREEEKHWPGWAVRPVEFSEEYFRRREQEWFLADRVVVNSEFCRQALVKQGVPTEKLVVIPLCFETKSENAKAEIRYQSQVSGFNFSASSPLRVLFLGQVILRKGIQYLIEVARQFGQENIQFDVVGPIGVSQEAVSSAPRNVTFHGRATRDQTAKWYRQSDVFVLPTLSDGFALTQLEAMAYGLPVITTPCCGDVVTDGIDGFIIPPRDRDALARTLQRYVMEPSLLKAQQTAALAKAGQFTQARLAANLLLLEQTLFQ